MHKRSGFTLIELLIVVAIIAILAAIAVPNFLEAQMRSKVSRVRNDFRAIGGALEAYFVDHNTYPDMQWIFGDINFSVGLTRLTTPVAYIAVIPDDPFVIQDGVHTTDKAIEYGSGVAGVVAGDNTNRANNIWLLESEGPDKTDLNGTPSFPYPHTPDSSIPQFMGYVYDPTNGTRSRGSVYRHGGVLPPEVAVRLFCIAINQ